MPATASSTVREFLPWSVDRDRHSPEVGCRGAAEEHDVLAGVGQRGSEERADRAAADDDDPHPGVGEAPATDGFEPELPAAA